MFSVDSKRCLRFLVQFGIKCSILEANSFFQYIHCCCHCLVLNHCENFQKNHQSWLVYEFKAQIEVNVLHIRANGRFFITFKLLYYHIKSQKKSQRIPRTKQTSFLDPKQDKDDRPLEVFTKNCVLSLLPIIITQPRRSYKSLKEHMCENKSNV